MAHDGFHQPSNGETHFITRTRLGKTQKQYARKLGVSLGKYNNMELDREHIKRVAIGRLTPNERCVLQRKRANKTQLEVATDLGLCRWWVNQMESGRQDCTVLASYWDQ